MLSWEDVSHSLKHGFLRYSWLYWISLFILFAMWLVEEVQKNCHSLMGEFASLLCLKVCLLVNWIFSEKRNLKVLALGSRIFFSGIFHNVLMFYRANKTKEHNLQIIRWLQPFTLFTVRNCGRSLYQIDHTHRLRCRKCTQFWLTLSYVQLSKMEGECSFSSLVMVLCCSMLRATILPAVVLCNCLSSQGVSALKTHTLIAR